MDANLKMSNRTKKACRHCGYWQKTWHGFYAVKPPALKPELFCLKGRSRCGQTSYGDCKDKPVEETESLIRGKHRQADYSVKTTRKACPSFCMNDNFSLRGRDLIARSSLRASPLLAHVLLASRTTGLRPRVYRAPPGRTPLCSARLQA